MARSNISTTLALVVALALGAGSAGAGSPGNTPQAHAAKPATALASQAKVSLDAARRTALAKVPGGKIKSSELEREKGRLIYSFDIQIAGKSGIEEVNVDASNGHVVSVGHESPKAERNEAKKEKP
jgi:uncharacterized membrane protein YkoI